MESSGAHPPSPPPSPAQSHPPPNPNMQVLNDECSGGEIASSHRPRRPNLSSLEIPGRPLETSELSSTRTNILPSATPRSSRAGLPPRSSSIRTKPSTASLPPQWSWIKNLTPTGDRIALLTPRSPLQELTNKSPISSTLSFTRALFSNAKKALSLPGTPIGNSCAESSQDTHVINIPALDKSQGQNQMARSHSVPGIAKGRSSRIVDSPCMIRVIPATPRPVPVENATEVEISEEAKDEGEDIPEEEAVCRICLIELGEGGETLKMECSCKGELALSHEKCAIKWFSIKGNKICDVCKQEVRNLPVILLRLQSTEFPNRRLANTFPHREETHYRMWHDAPALVMVSILAYFCFLEQLLVIEMGKSALALSLPFCCVLGLLSSFIAYTMVSKRFVWAYASFQFAIVVLFAHIYYTLLKIVVVFSILLSSFTGFGIAIGANTLFVEFLKWRTRRSILYAQQQGNGSQQQPSENSIEAEQDEDTQLQEAVS